MSINLLPLKCHSLRQLYCKLLFYSLFTLVVGIQPVVHFRSRSEDGKLCNKVVISFL